MHPLWSAIFGTAAPVEVEIGPGTGTFLLTAAGRWPGTNFFGVEHSHARAARLEAAICVRGLANARVVSADAACVVSTLIPPDSVHAYHVYFPDPWWKRRHHRRRLFTPSFATALARTLVPGGRVYVATDVDETFGLILDTLAGCGSFCHIAAAGPSRMALTAFERKGLARGATIKEASFIRELGCEALPLSQHSSAAPITPAESPS